METKITKQTKNKIISIMLLLSLVIQIAMPAVYAGGGDPEEGAITITLEDEDKLTINSTGYVLGTNAEVPHTGPYVLKGSTRSVVTINSSCDLVLSDLTINVGVGERAISADGKYDISIRLEGSNVIKGFINLLNNEDEAESKGTFTITADNEEEGGSASLKVPTIETSGYNIKILGGSINFTVHAGEYAIYDTITSKPVVLTIDGASVNIKFEGESSSKYSCFSGFHVLKINRSIISMRGTKNLYLSQVFKVGDESFLSQLWDGSNYILFSGDEGGS